MEETLEQINIILKIPKNTVSLQVIPTVIKDNDTLKQYQKKLTLDDLNTARKDFLDNVQDGDDYDGYWIVHDDVLNQLKDNNYEE